MKFFIYARKSTEDEARQVLSIDSQLDELRAFARKESLNVVREYIEAKTAKEPGRPVFNEMMEAVENGPREPMTTISCAAQSPAYSMTPSGSPLHAPAVPFAAAAIPPHCSKAKGGAQRRFLANARPDWVFR